MNNVTADEIKASVAAHFRYKRQYDIIAFEGCCQLVSWKYRGGFGDILVVSKDRYLYEIEVKVSMADLRKDRAKRKHGAYMNEYNTFPTRYFYFAVPRELANKAALLCDELYPYAGVMGSNGNGWDDVGIYRRAKQLNGHKLSYKELLYMVRTQSATLCRMAEALAKERKELRRFKNNGQA